MTTSSQQFARVGMVATVRNRRGLIVSVDPYDTRPDGRLHLVRVEYTDGDGVPEDSLVWERERNRALLEPTALPRVEAEPAMPAHDFDALPRTCNALERAHALRAPRCKRRRKSRSARSSSPNHRCASPGAIVHSQETWCVHLCG